MDGRTTPRTAATDTCGENVIRRTEQTTTRSGLNSDCYLSRPLVDPLSYRNYSVNITPQLPGRVAQSVGHLTRKSEVLGSIPGLATYFRFSFC